VQCSPATQTKFSQPHTDALFPTLAEYRMSRYAVTPNMLIMPPQMLLYMALAPEQSALRRL